MSKIEKLRKKAEDAWTDCDSCNSNDKSMWINGYIVGALANEIQLPTDKTTRFEVIDGAGRRLVEYGVNIEISMQDDGRTMKVFLTKIKGGQE